jgi:hypothetical protein
MGRTAFYLYKNAPFSDKASLSGKFGNFVRHCDSFFNSFHAPDKAAAKTKTGLFFGNGGKEVPLETN